jgi:uncharacterized membrane protein
MSSRFKNILYDFKTSFWFLPLIITIAGLLLAELVMTIDRSLPFELDRIFIGSYLREADAARALLGSIASTTVTLVGLVFSITFVALVLASQQYGPRMLGNFTRDPQSRAIAGLFLATFVYCTIVAGAIRENETEFTIPQMAIVVGLGLGLLCVIGLIYYIHHLANSIRSEYIVKRVATDIRDMIDHLYPEEIGMEPPDGYPPPALTNGQQILAQESGFFQNIIGDDLINAAKRHNVVLEMEYTPGEFVLAGTPLVTAYGQIDNFAALQHDIQEAIDLGRERTVEQDVRFAFDKLVETGVRSLSPAINDPMTSMMCLDRLAEGLIYLARHHNGQPYRLDSDGQLRLVVERPITFVDMVGVAFTQIRRYGKNDLEVMLHILRLLRRIGMQAHTPEAQEALRIQAQLVRQQCEASGSYLPAELALINKHCDRTEQWLNRPPSGQPIRTTVS